MGTREAYRTVLIRACVIAGDETLLAKSPGVPVKSLVDWLLGDAPVPAEVFLRAVDIVTAAYQVSLKDHQRQVRDNRALLAQIKFRHRRWP